MLKSKRLNQRRWNWTTEQLSQVKNEFPHIQTKLLAQKIGCSVSALNAKAYVLGLKKTAEYLSLPQSGRMQPGDVRGASSRFVPEQEPWNKGTHFTAGGRSAETRFKPGGRPHTWVPVGTYRINGDGMLELKVNDLPGANHVRWHPVSRLVWIEANGPVPANHIVVFKPGRATTVLERITPDAVECISRAENARRNHPRNHSPELAKLVQLKGAITRQVNRIQREAQEQSA